MTFTTRGRTTRTRRLCAAAGLCAGTVLLTGVTLAAGSGAADAATSSGQVYVLQGIAGETVSVNVDNRTVASGVTARKVVGPLTLSAGRHTLQLWRGSGAIAQASFTLSAGASLDLVAHRFPDASRAPGITTFTNDTSAVPPGKSRLLVAHTAVVPPADVLVNGAALIRNIANGESSTKTVPAGSYSVSIVPTATTGPAVLGPTTLTIGSGTLTSVFAIGDPAAGTMDAIVQVLPVATSGSGTPARVNSGDGGQAAGLFAENRRSTPVPGWATGAPLGVLAALGLLATVVVGLLTGRPTALRRRRSRT